VAIEKGTALAVRLMQYGRKQDTPIRDVQVNEIVNAVLALVRPLIKSQVHLKIEQSHGLPEVRADSAKLEQLLLNIILNALDAMPDGGELAVRTERVFDAVPDGKHGEKKHFILITVADTGIGIPENLLPNIFDPFVTTKPIGEGTGLGLSSAQLIVRQHNGHIRVESSPGVGTKFGIYLPVHPYSLVKSEGRNQGV
jgi:signal transduction histidine kinase